MKTPTFKELIQRDVKQVFLNPEEYGEEHMVQGKPMVIVSDDLENIEREKKMKSNMDGIHARQILFYVSAEDFGPLPAPKGLIDLDGQKYVVLEATDEAGMYAITVEAHRSTRR